ncbi:hypothetical protein ACOKFD_16870 [Flagellimonas sp. S174]|uniref:hypothetical protein n=1 Tax=Flagellimonas sp. S174 TaxID=3410790 RepID=UPI003BF54954
MNQNYILKVLILCFSLSTKAQNPTGYTAEKSDNTSASFNLKNPLGFWHLSGPRSYENGSNFSIFWNDGIYKRYFTILDNGKVGIGNSNPDYNLDVYGNSNPRVRIKHLNENATWGLHIGQNDDLTGLIEMAGRDLVVSPGWTNKLFLGVPQFDQNGGKVIIRGLVGIGTEIPDSKLTVKGKIHAEEVKVDLSVPGPDYVFKEDYDLKPLEEVQNYIKENGHLPNIPSAKEMEENGIQLGDMNMKLLEKIEELTLYTLEQEKKLVQQETRLRQLEQLLNTNQK